VYEDGFYPEPKEYLLKLVAKHLKPIHYDAGLSFIGITNYKET
jgi:hypothetical protein